MTNCSGQMGCNLCDWFSEEFEAPTEELLFQIAHSKVKKHKLAVHGISIKDWK